VELDEADLRRERKVEQYGVVGEPTSPDLQALADLAAGIVGAPMAAINLLTSQHQYMVATSGLDPSVCSTQESMCAVVVGEPQPVVVPDARDDPRFADNPFVTGVLDSFRFYASAPLLTPDGVPVGRLCVFDHEPRELDDRHRDALNTLAARAMDVLELRLRTRQLQASLAQLTEARDELQRSNHELSRFAQQISHDLRTPLTGILVNAELLAGETLVQTDDDMRETIDDIVESARRMDDLIGQVLAYGQEGGRLALARVRLEDVFGRARRDADALVRQRGATVVVDDLPEALCDADLVYSVALNLLTNALKFARPGHPPRVVVTGESSGDRVRIRVQDNGVGIPADQVDDVFEMHVRAVPPADGGADSSSPEGHGIGLATTKRIVEAHRGRIGVELGDGPGTSIWFELPA
jgi:signal transduction histidine kinase